MNGSILTLLSIPDYPASTKWNWMFLTWKFNGTMKAGGASIWRSERYITSFRAVSYHTNTIITIRIAIFLSSAHFGLLHIYSMEWDNSYMQVHQNWMPKAGDASIWRSERYNTSFRIVEHERETRIQTRTRRLLVPILFVILSAPPPPLLLLPHHRHGTTTTTTTTTPSLLLSLSCHHHHHHYYLYYNTNNLSFFFVCWFLPQYYPSSIPCCSIKKEERSVRIDNTFCFIDPHILYCMYCLLTHLFVLCFTLFHTT